MVVHGGLHCGDACGSSSWAVHGGLGGLTSGSAWAGGLILSAPCSQVRQFGMQLVLAAVEWTDGMASVQPAELGWGG